MENSKLYAFPKKLKFLMRLCGVIFITFGIGGLGIFWLDPPRDPWGAAFILCAGLAFLLVGWYTFRVVPRLDAWIEADATGLTCCRPDGTRKTVNWHDVGKLRERPLLQRLEFVAGNDSSVVRVDYQIERFAELREFIVSHLRDDVPLHFPVTCGKSPRYFLVNIAGMALPAAGLIYLRDHHYLLSLGLFFVIYMIAWEFVSAPTAVTIMDQSLTVRFPFRSRTVYVFQIEGIRMEDRIVKGNRHPYVLLEVTGEKPIKLQSLGCSTVQLYRILCRFKDQQSG